MKGFVDTTQRNSKVRAVALLLLAVVLAIPQLAWADHTSNHPARLDYSLPDNSAGGAYVAPVGRYRSETLASHTTAPLASPEQVGAAFLVANPEATLYRRHAITWQQQFAAREAVASTARWLALGAYYQDAAAIQAAASTARWLAMGAYYQDAAAIQAAASTARWLAMGAYYTRVETTFQAANPEVRVFQRYIAADSCSQSSQVC